MPFSSPFSAHDPMTKTARNLLVVVGAEVVASLFGFLSTAYLGKTLGISNFGLVAFGMAFLSYFVILTGLGFPATGAVSIARDRQHWQVVAGRVISMQFLASLLLLAMYVPFSSVSAPDDRFLDLMKIYGYAVLLVPLSLHWFFMGFERGEMMAFAQILRQGVYLGMVLLFVRGPGDILWAPISFLGSVAVPGLFLFFSLMREGGPRFSPVRLSENRALLRRGLPACFSEIMIQLYYSADMIMIGWMRPVRELSLYAGAYTIITFLFSLKNQINWMLLPVLTRKRKESPDFSGQIQTVYYGLSSLAVPLAVGGTCLAGPIMVFVFGRGFLGADVAFGLLVWSAAAALMGIPFTILYHVEDRQKVLLRISATMVTFNLCANLMVIPFFGYVGAACVTVASEFLQLTLLIRRGGQFARFDPLRPLLGPALASGVMAFFLIGWEGSHALIRIGVGAIIYLAMIQVDPRFRALVRMIRGGGGKKE